MAKKKKSSRGRPSKWTKENREKIIMHLENGSNYHRACILSEVCDSTFMDWKAQGKKDKEEGKITEYSDFLEEIERAKVKYIAWLQQSVNDTAKIDGKFALEVLSRKLPDEFGRKDRLDLNNNIKGEIEYILPPEIQEVIDKNKEN